MIPVVVVGSESESDSIQPTRCQLLPRQVRDHPFQFFRLGMRLRWKHMVRRKVWRERMYAALQLHADEMGVTYMRPWTTYNTRTLSTCI